MDSLTHEQWSLIWAGILGMAIGVTGMILYHLRAVSAIGRQLAHLIMNMTPAEQVAYLKDIRDTLKLTGKLDE